MPQFGQRAFFPKIGLHHFKTNDLVVCNISKKKFLGPDPEKSCSGKHTRIQTHRHSDAETTKRSFHLKIFISLQLFTTGTGPVTIHSKTLKFHPPLKDAV